MNVGGPKSSKLLVPFEDSLHSARLGSENQVGALLEQCRPYLLTIAQAELPGDLQGKLGASDLVQDALLRGVQHFTSFRGHTQEELAGWLRQILINRLANVREAFATDMRAVTREQPADSRLVDPLHESAGRHLQRHEDEATLSAALSRLPQKCQRIITLRHRENRTFGQIADAFGISTTAARNLWARALQELQRELKSAAISH